jgi:hypothetical protein
VKLLRKSEVVKEVRQRGLDVRSDQLGCWVRDGVLQAAGRDGFGLVVFRPDVVDRVVALLTDQRKAAKR